MAARRSGRGASSPADRTSFQPVVGGLLELVMLFAMAALWIRCDGAEAVVALLVALGDVGPCGPAHGCEVFG